MKSHFKNIHNDTYSDIFAVSWEVHLYDEARDSLTVATTIQGRAGGQIVEIYALLLGTDG